MKSKQQFFALWFILVSALFTLSACAPAVVGTGAGVGYKVVSDERSVRSVASDGAMAASIKLRLVGERDVLARRVNVDVVHGYAFLSGLAANEDERQLAERIAAGEDGIKGVKNNIRIGFRTWAQASRDRATTLKVRAALVGDERIRGLTISINVFQDVAFLYGVVATPELRERISKVVGDLDEIVEVVNDVMVRASPRPE